MVEPVQLPVILLGPQSQNEELALTYKWRCYGNNIAGATDSSLSLTSVQFVSAGLYDVVVGNANGCIGSPTAVLNVLPYVSGELNDDLLTLTWPGAFILQEAPECTGPLGLAQRRRTPKGGLPFSRGTFAVLLASLLRHNFHSAFLRATSRSFPGRSCG